MAQLDYGQMTLSSTWGFIWRWGAVLKKYMVAQGGGRRCGGGGGEMITDPDLKCFATRLKL
jgi:hypothetical protein